MNKIEIRTEVEDLLHAYVGAIDEGRLEDWPGFFAEKCLYEVIPWENASRGFPIPLIRCDSQGMLRDRIVAHRNANVFAPHLYRHIVSAVRVLGEDQGVITARANFAVFRTMLDAVEYGSTALYSTGEYRDTIVFENGGARYREKIVVLDTSRVASLLVTPI
jgi:anthranilate 1,2-dioxygenase small subunit